MKGEKLSVMDFYDRKSIFITGATGGIGKLLMEKLLRCCPNVERIYILVRAKKGKVTSERLADLIDTPVFDGLRRYDPDAFLKVNIVEGDLCLPDLGLSDEDKEILIRNISVVFHCAASVRFDMTLEDAVDHNVFGTRRLVQLCHQMMKIEAFIHVSTLFSTCNKPTIEECIPTIPGINGVIDFTKNDDDFIKMIPAEVTEEWPNTYTFSKALTEVMLDDQRGRLPVSIVRPSVVLSSWREPIPGWIDNFYGPTLLIVNGALGILRSMICHGEKIADIIPSDMVINLLLCVACKVTCEGPDKMKIYNLCSGRQNPVKTKLITEESQKYFRIYPLMSAIRYPNLTPRSSRVTHAIISAGQHRLLAYVLDLFALCTFRKARMSRIHKSLSRVTEATLFFAVHEWTVFDHNVESLNGELSEKERDVFFFDVKKVDWKLYVKDYALGVRKHLLKEDMDNLEKAVARMKKLYWIEKFLQTCIPAASFFAMYLLIKRRRRRS